MNRDGSRVCISCSQKGDGPHRLLARISDAAKDHAAAAALLEEGLQALAQLPGDEDLPLRVLSLLRSMVPADVQDTADRVQELVRAVLPALVQHLLPGNAAALAAAEELAKKLHVIIGAVSHTQQALHLAWEEAVLLLEVRQHTADGKSAEVIRHKVDRLQQLRAARETGCSEGLYQEKLLQQDQGVMVFVAEEDSLLLQHLLIFSSLHSSAVQRGRWGTEGATLSLFTHCGFSGLDAHGEEVPGSVKSLSAQLVIAAMVVVNRWYHLTFNPQAPQVSLSWCGWLLNPCAKNAMIVAYAFESRLLCLVAPQSTETEQIWGPAGTLPVVVCMTHSCT
jgi:hypothetical protein